MRLLKRLASTGLVLWSLSLMLSGCVVAEPREGYYDHEHHRWYHEHVWVTCGPADEHCR